MFDGSEDRCKIWRKNGSCFLKWHEEFGKFLFTDWKIMISMTIQNNQIDQMQCEKLILPRK